MFAIEFTDFSWKYLGAENWTLKNINLKIKKGEFIGIMGASGAGKTTLALCLNGLIPHRIPGMYKGNVTILGKPVKQTMLPELTKKVGLLFQDPETQFISMRVRNEIAFGLENYSVPPEEIERRILDVSDKLNITHLLDKTPTELSGGQKQKVALASILAMNPEIIVLDEPVSDLDPVGKEEVYEAISSLKQTIGSTIVVIDHESEFLLEKADRIILMENGEIVLETTTNDFVEYIEVIERCGETVPSISKIFYHMKKNGKWNERIPFTIEDALSEGGAYLKSLYDSGKHFAQGLNNQNSFEESIIEVDNLTYVYPDGTKALSDVSLSVKRGEFLAIVGANGSGKTTLAKHFNGLLKPTSGRLKICGIEIPGGKTSELSKYVGYVFQNPDHQLFCNTVFEELCFSPLQLGKSRTESEREASVVMEWLNLSRWRDEHPFFLGKGQRRRLAVGAVLTMNPHVLVVDEPTTGQDWRSSIDMMNLLTRLNNDRKITTIIITHDMKIVAQFCKRVIAMREGRILFDGSTRKLFTNFEIMKKSGLKPPQLVVFFSRLFGIDEHHPLTTEEALNRLKL